MEQMRAKFDNIHIFRIALHRLGDRMAMVVNPGFVPERHRHLIEKKRSTTSNLTFESDAKNRVPVCVRFRYFICLHLIDVLDFSHLTDVLHFFACNLSTRVSISPGLFPD
jgi:hypothetical protein